MPAFAEFQSILFTPPANVEHETPLQRDPTS
jgi:hypothetical protein